MNEEERKIDEEAINELELVHKKVKQQPPKKFP